MKERDEKKARRLAPATICYFSSPWHPEQPLSGKECASLAASTAPKTRPGSRSPPFRQQQASERLSPNRRHFEEGNGPFRPRPAAQRANTTLQSYGARLHECATAI